MRQLVREEKELRTQEKERRKEDRRRERELRREHRARARELRAFRAKGAAAVQPDEDEVGRRLIFSGFFKMSVAF